MVKTECRIGARRHEKLEHDLKTNSAIRIRSYTPDRGGGNRAANSWLNIEEVHTVGNMAK